MDQTKLSLEHRHLGVPSGASKTISTPMVCLMQTMHLSCTDKNNLSKQTEMRFHVTHVTKEFHQVCQKLFLSLWRSVLTLHLSCVVISTISKWTKTSFHLGHVTSEYHWVRPKWFLSLWYVRRKPCTYLALKLRPSLNKLKRDSRRPMSPRSSNGCVKNDFWAYRTFTANRAPVLHED
jgi:hypothetical protein